MNSIYKVKEEQKIKIPAVIHVNDTARVQTVSLKDNPKFHQLISAFKEKTCIPMLLNTSLNVNEPICENPENAFEIFSKTSMYLIAIQNCVLLKK